MAVNLLLMKENEEALALSRKLGFTKTFFLEKDLILVEGKSKKELLKKIQQAKNKKKITLARPADEETLRFLLEKTEIDIIYGQELINKDDSPHFRRGGLDQIYLKIAAERGKTIGFSFREILISKERGRLIGRMSCNLRLCRKYGVPVLFSNFSAEALEMRGKHELNSFWEVFGGKGTEFSRL